MKLTDSAPKQMDIFEPKAGIQDTDFKQMECTFSILVVSPDFVFDSLKMCGHALLYKKGICLSTYSQIRKLNFLKTRKLDHKMKLGISCLGYMLHQYNQPPGL